MSFFHTLGMEEDDNGDWVVRFVQNSNKLSLTEETKEILPKVFEAFNTATDRLIKELFGGDKEVQLLLLRYVMTQLVSDAAFCIGEFNYSALDNIASSCFNDLVQNISCLQRNGESREVETRKEVTINIT